MALLIYGDSILEYKYKCIVVEKVFLLPVALP